MIDESQTSDQIVGWVKSIVTQHQHRRLGEINCYPTLTVRGE